VVDAAVAYDRAELPAGSECEIAVLFPRETTRASFHIAHWATTACWVLLAMIQVHNAAMKRLVMLALLLLMGVTVTVVCQFP
jgi:hypothetical protein